MKTFPELCLVILVCSMLAGGSVRAQEAATKEPTKTAPVKHIPTPGHFEIEVTSGDKAKTYDHPSKALSEIGRAVSRAKRAKEGEEPLFEAVLTLNEQTFTFSDPEDALEACKAVTNALRDLPKLKMGLGDLGNIPQLTAEELAAAQATAQKTPAAARAEVQRRIQAALMQQLAPSGGTTGRATMRRPNPQQMQQIINQEIEKARQEGLLPNPVANVGFAGGDPREAQKEVILQGLAFALSQADSTTKAGEETPKPEASEN